MQVKEITIGDRTWTVRTDKPGDTLAIQEVYVDDCYKVSDMIRDDVAKTNGYPWYLDVGGHVGAFSALVLKHNPMANIIAVEPNHESASILRKNLQVEEREADGHHNVHVIEKGLRHDGANLLTSHVASTLGNKVVKRGQEGGDYPALYEIETITIEEIVKQFKVDWFYLTKLDCELSEHDILPAMAKISEKFGYVVGEWHAKPFVEFSSELMNMFPGFNQIQRNVVRDHRGRNKTTIDERRIEQVLCVTPTSKDETMGMFRLNIARRRRRG